MLPLGAHLGVRRHGDLGQRPLDDVFGQRHREERLKFRAIEHLLLVQSVANEFQSRLMFGEDALRGVFRATHDLAHFLVDLAGGFLAIVALLGEVAAQENRLLLVTKSERTDARAHADIR